MRSGVAGNENSGGWNRGMRKQFCVNGHDTFKAGRFPSNGACRECSNEYGKRKRRERRA